MALPLSGVEAQDRGNLLTSGITGSVAPDQPRARMPGYVLGLERVQRLMLDLAEAPRDSSYLASVLAETGVTASDLLAMGLVRETEGAFVIDFAFFTVGDLQALRNVSERYGQSLAREYLRRRREFEEIFSRYPLTQVGTSAVAFFVLGCVSLDWDGLSLTEELGYRGVKPERLGGRGYLPYAQEVSSELPIKEYYWGSHNEYLNAGALTSFGDHFSPRTALPDLAWRVQERVGSMELAETVRRPLSRWASRDVDQLMSDVVGLMMQLRNGERSAEELAALVGIDPMQTSNLLDLLEALEYVKQEEGQYAAAIPVLGPDDVPMVRDAVALSRQIMSTWLEENYHRIRSDLGAVTPVRYGVPYEEAFTQIWHYIFGTTNRILAEEGMFFDPYGGTRRYQGFLPVVFHHAIRGAGRAG